MKKKIEKILRKVLGKAEFDILIPEQEEFGHYSTNAALKLAQIGKKPAHQKVWYSGKSPLDIAGQIVAKIEKTAPRGFFEKIEIAAPGFINFWISKEVLRGELFSISKQKEKYGRSDIGKNKKVIVEYSAPNVAKPMHVGHLRSTVIGDSLANMYEFLGYKVIRWNYIGDWGTQFGKLIAAYKRWGNKAAVEKMPIDELLALYIKFHKEEAANPVLAQEARDEFMKLESGNAQSKKLWEWFRRESLKEFKKIYGILGIKFDIILGEAFFEPYLKPLIERLYKKKIAQESEGALIVPLENLPPALIQKSDESSLYLTRDIANLEYRLKKYKPVKIIYVVSNEQTLYFSQLFAVAQKMRLRTDHLVHVKFGMVLGEKGRKFSTRSGEAVKLQELLGKSIDLARKVVEKKNSKLKAKEKEKIATAVGLGAVKYNDLKENRLSDISFDWDRMLDFSGDSAPYLQYTHARLKSIIRKARTAKSQTFKEQINFLEMETEMALIRKMIEFSDTIERSSEIYMTNSVAKYLYELANLANTFYESTPILTDKNTARRSARLTLIHSVASIMKNGLGLLGIKAPEKI